MAFQKGQKVYLKNVPQIIYGTVANVIDEGPGEDPSIVFHPESIRRRASNFESAEIPESPLEKWMRVMNGPLGQVPELLARNPTDPELLEKFRQLLRELGVLRQVPRK